MAFTKDSEEFKMMADYYTLIKEFWEVKKDDKYWITLVEKTDAFVQKYDRATNGFSGRIGYAFLNQCEKNYYDSCQVKQKARSDKKKGTDDKITTEKK